LKQNMHVDTKKAKHNNKKLGKTTAHRFPNPSRLSLPAKVQLNGKKGQVVIFGCFLKWRYPQNTPK